MVFDVQKMNHKEGKMCLSKNMKIGIISLVIVFIAGFASFSYASSSENEKALFFTGMKREVYVSGTGSVQLEPDTAYLQIGIVAEHEQAQEAQAKNAEISKKVVQALETLGIEKKDIRTMHYVIQPMYKYQENRQPELIGYQTTQNLSITIRQMEKLGSALDLSVKAGANRVNQISFGVFDSREAQMQALELAVKDARKRAEVALNADGESALKMIQLNISSGSNPPPAPAYGRDMGKAENSAPELMPGQTDITVTVQAVFTF
jgi:uncharacterized protein